MLDNWQKLVSLIQKVSCSREKSYIYRKISVDKKVELTPDFSGVDPLDNQLRLDRDGTVARA